MSINSSRTSNFSQTSIEDCYMTYVVRSPSTSYIINSVVGCVVNAIFAILGSFLNSLVIWIFWKTPKLRQRVCYFMIMVLSSVDLCVAIFVHPLHLVNSIAEITETSKCLYKICYHTSVVILSGTSAGTFFIMNIERYFSIVHPMFHRIYVTKKKCLILSGFIFAISATTSLAPIFKIDIQIFVTILVLIVCLGTLFIYISIFYVARKQSFNPNIVGRNPNIAVQEGVRTSTEKPNQRPRNTMSFFQDLLLAKAYLLVLFCNFFFQLPNAILLAVSREELTTLNDAVQLKIWTISLVAMTSTINCLIFFWANKILRKEGVKIVKNIFHLS